MSLLRRARHERDPRRCARHRKLRRGVRGARRVFVGWWRGPTTREEGSTHRRPAPVPPRGGNFQPTPKGQFSSGLDNVRSVAAPPWKPQVARRRRGVAAITPDPPRRVRLPSVTVTSPRSARSRAVWQFATPVTASRLAFAQSALSIAWWAPFSEREVPGATRMKVRTVADPPSLLSAVESSVGPESIRPL
jgi:hypothetical protein